MLKLIGGNNLSVKMLLLLLFSYLTCLSASTAPTRSPTTKPTCSPSIVPTVSPSSYLSIYYNIYLSAGASASATSSSGTGGKATAAKFVTPIGLYQDTTGMIYVADDTDNCIRSYNPNTDSIVKSVAGVCGGTGDQQNKPATSALLSGPNDIFGDTNGNVYIADYSNHKVKKVYAGYITVFGGTGSTGQDGDGGQATAANMGYPNAMFIDSVGTMYVVMYMASTVRTIATNGIIILFAGVTGANAYTGDGGRATSAKFNYPRRTYVDTTGLAYISDAGNNRIRQVTSSGIVSLYAGSGSSAYLGENLPLTSANLNNPNGMTMDPVSFDFYFCDTGQSRVYYVPSSSGLLNTFAGTGSSGNTGNGGAATAATFSEPRVVVLESTGNVYVNDRANANVRLIIQQVPSVSPTVVPTTTVPTVVPTTAAPSAVRGTLNSVFLYAGSGSTSSSGNGGPATSAGMYAPRSVWQDTAGVTYFTEGLNSNCARKISTAGIVSGYAGVCTGTGSYSGDGGAATSAGMNQGVGLFISTVGVGYIAEYGNSRVRAVSASGIITTYAGTGSTTNSGNGGPATSGGINQCHGVWVNSVGVLYVTSLNSHQVRAVSASGILSLFVGSSSSTSGYSGDGGQATAALINGAEKLVGDSTGVVYVGDSNNNRVRTISTSNIISLLIGSGGTTWVSDNMPATSAVVYFPESMWKDSSNGDVYVSARTGNRVLALTYTSGLVSTYAGSGVASSGGDGGAATSGTLNGPDGMYLSTTGVLYVTESSGHKIRQVYSVSPTAGPTAVPSFAPSGPTLGPTTTPSMLPTVSSAPSAVPTAMRGTLNNVYLYAGTGTPSTTGTGGPAASATVNQPRSVYQDSAGVTYFSEGGGNCVRKVSTSGIVSAYAGACTTTGSYSGDGGAATSAGMNAPVGLFISTTGVGYVAEFNNNRVRAVSASGIIITYAGTGSVTNSGNGGPATSGGIYQTHGLWFNSVGVLYVTSLNAHQVRAVSANGILSLFIGSSSATSGYSGDGGQATAALINGAEKLTGDSTGVVYVADSNNNRVRSVATSGIISLLMGSGGTTWVTDNMAATSAIVNFPDGMWKDSSNGDVYVSARGINRVLALTYTSGLVSTYAGTGSASSGGDGGAATSGTLNGPDGLYLTTGGVLFVTETSGHKIRQVYSVSPTAGPTAVPSFAPSGPTLGPTLAPTSSPSSVRGTLNNVYLYAGTGSSTNGGTGGPATSANMNQPRSVYQDTAGLIYWSEGTGNCVRRISAAGIVQAFAGTCGSIGGTSGDGGAATSANMNTAGAIFITTGGLTYVAEYGGNRVRVVSSAGIITTYAGTGSTTNSGNGGPATSGGINQCHGVWVNSVGVLYVTSLNSHQVRAVSASGILSLFVGSSSSTSGYSGDGGQATAALINGAERIAGDSTGLLYLSDSSNNRVRTIDTSNTINLFMGSGGTTSYVENAPATSAVVYFPDDLKVDGGNGDVYVSARSANKVLALTRTTLLVSTYVGTGAVGSSGDGAAATSATVNQPDGLFLTTGGSLYIIEISGAKMRLVYNVAPTSAPSVVPSIAPSALPTIVPSMQPSVAPTVIPSVMPSVMPTVGPTVAPTVEPTIAPSTAPSAMPTVPPSVQPSVIPTVQPSVMPLVAPSLEPSLKPTVFPSVQPSVVPTVQPSVVPSAVPSVEPSLKPTVFPSVQPSVVPSVQPSVVPSAAPSVEPSLKPTVFPSVQPSVVPTVQPSVVPSAAPSVEPSLKPTVFPSVQPSVVPTVQPSVVPSAAPRVEPSLKPTVFPSVQPSVVPTVQPSVVPSAAPSIEPSLKPTVVPSVLPSIAPSVIPSLRPTRSPASSPTLLPVGQSPSYKVTNALAFAGITSEGGVMSWGAACCGGDSSSVSGLLSSGVSEVVASKNAFAALKSDGSVVAWGRSGDIVGWSEFSSSSNGGSNIVSLVAAEQAFAGVTSDGGVIAFGADCCGGNVDQYGWGAYVSEGVVSVRASAGAFCALKSDGSVYCWGSQFAGGGVSSLSRSDVSDVVMLSSTRSAFAGLTSDGSVVVWGNKAFGGSMSNAVVSAIGNNALHIVSSASAFVGYTTSGLSSWGKTKQDNEAYLVGNYKYIAATAYAFAALKFNGTLTSWGSSSQGGDASSVAASLGNVTTIVGNNGAFAAITSEGGVIAWGESESGGRLYGNVSSGIGSGVSVIYQTSRAFAVVNGVGGVTAWGSSTTGGSIDTAIASELSSGVSLLCANDNAFTAIKADGSAYAWGHESSVVVGVVSGNFNLVESC